MWYNQRVRGLRFAANGKIWIAELVVPEAFEDVAIEDEAEADADEVAINAGVQRT